MSATPLARSTSAPAPSATPLARSTSAPAPSATPLARCAAVARTVRRRCRRLRSRGHECAAFRRLRSRVRRVRRPVGDAACALDQCAGPVGDSACAVDQCARVVGDSARAFDECAGPVGDSACPVDQGACVVGDSACPVDEDGSAARHQLGPRHECGGPARHPVGPRDQPGRTLGHDVGALDQRARPACDQVGPGDQRVRPRRHPGDPFHEHRRRARDRLDLDQQRLDAVDHLVDPHGQAFDDVQQPRDAPWHLSHEPHGIVGPPQHRPRALDHVGGPDPHRQPGDAQHHDDDPPTLGRCRASSGPAARFAERTCASQAPGTLRGVGWVCEVG